jgi:hypothetical protein
MYNIQEYKKFRKKYRPKKIKVLFIAESPPVSGKYFYFENQAGYKASLFGNMMKALYAKEYEDKLSSRNKKYFLSKFQKDRFFLIDTYETPINNKSNAERREIIRKNLPRLLKEIKVLTKYGTKIILIKKTTVCEILREPLKDKVIGELPFPGSGNQNKFIKELKTKIGEERLGKRPTFNH